MTAPRVLFSRWPAAPENLVTALRPYISSASRVLMVPLAHDRDCDRAAYDRKYGIGGRHHASAVEAFSLWGIPAEQIEVAHAFADDRNTIRDKIAQADILLLPGGLPDLAVQRVDALGLRESIRSHSGLVMGYSAGALMMMTDYFISPDEDYPILVHTHGLGLVGRDLHIEVHYEASSETDALLQSIADTSQRPVYAMTDAGAIIIELNAPPRRIGDVRVFRPLPPSV